LFRARPHPPRSIFVFVLLGIGFCASSTSSRTLDVPASFPTISDALNEAIDGDVVEIGPGIYSRDANGERFPLELRGRRIVLRGAGAWRTILDAEGESRHFRFVEGDSSTLEDAALVSGFAADDGGAIWVVDSSPTIRRVRILECESQAEGNAIAVSRSRASLENVLAARNGRAGATVLLEHDRASRVHRCTFEENAGIAILVRGGSPQIARNVFTRPGEPSGLAVAILVQDARGGEAGIDGEGNFFQECAQGEALVLSSVRPVQEISASERMRPLSLKGSRRGELASTIDAGAFSGGAPLEKSSGLKRSEDVPVANLGATPNPFSPQTTLSYTVEMQTVVDLGVFNILGQRIRTLFAGDRSPGEYWETWDGRDDLGREMPPGVYYARVTQGAETESKRIVLVR